MDEPLADGEQQAVARRVAEALVDDLEPIEIEQGDRDRLRRVAPVTRQGVRDPVGQELAVRQAGRRVVQGATLGDVDEAGVVEPDRGKLREAGKRLDIAVAPLAARLTGRQPEHPDHPTARGERHRDHGPEDADRHVGGASGPAVVVGEDDRLAAAGDFAGEALVERDPEAQQVGVEARADSQDQRGLIRFEQVDEGVRRAEQRRGPREDRVEQAVLVEPVEQGQGGLVEGPQVGIAQDAVAAAAFGGFDLVERAVSDRHELGLRAAVGGEAGDTRADRHDRPRLAAGHVAGTGAGADRASDPFCDLVRGQSIGARQERGEFVAAVAVQPVAVACRAAHRAGDLDEQTVAGRVTQGVVERLERIEVEHEQGERPARLDGGAELALERTVVAQAGQGIVLGAHADLAVRLGVLERDGGLSGEQLRQLELVGAEGGLGLADAPDVQRADGLAVDQQRDDDHRLGLEWGAWDLDGARIEVGHVGQHGLGVVDRPARDAAAAGDLVGEDLVGPGVAGDDRPAGPGRPVHAVHGQRVVRDDGLQRVGDQVQHAGGVEHREQPLVDLEEAALTVQLVLQLGLLAVEALEVLGVDQGLDRRRREDRERQLVLGIEAVAPEGRNDDDALDDGLVDHRHDEHGFDLIGRREEVCPRIAPGITERIGRACSATQPVRPWPIRRRRASAPGSLVPRSVPSNASGSHIPVAWSTR